MGVTFALVHGAYHGAWCWERLIEPLRARGCGAVAMDLPCDDPDAGLAESANAIAAAVAGCDDEVVVVGHSLGGLSAPLVAMRRPVHTVVYLAAFVPVPGDSMADQFRTSPEPVTLLEGGRETDELGRSRWTDAATTARTLFAGLCAGDVEWAFPLLRPQAQRPLQEPCPDDLPDVRAISLVCSGDAVVNPSWSRRVARERLGGDPIELPTGHFPMMTDPELLADALATAVA